MDVEPFDPSMFSGELPIFPLPNAVLVPNGVMPLHVFEPRYRAMTRAALEGERLIGMALLKAGWEEDYMGCPPFHPVVGVGRVIQETRLPDGRYNLVLLGVARARVVAEIQTEPFRMGRVELLQDREPTGKGWDRKRRVLLGFYRQVLRELVKDPGARPPDDLPLGPLCDLLVSVLAVETPVRQALLEEVDVGARCDRILKLLESARAPSPDGPPRRWPPSPSMN